jgi:hypothetical protein
VVLSYEMARGDPDCIQTTPRALGFHSYTMIS